MRLKLVPADTHIDFFRFAKATFGISILLVIISLALLPTRGLNFGIDFKGGSMITTETPAEVPVADYRAVLSGLELGDYSVTEIVDPAAALTGAAAHSMLIRIDQSDGDPAIQNDKIVAVKDALTAEIPEITFLSTESVGAKVSGELVKSGFLAIALAVAAILFYVWLRFEWQFALGAVAALVHDVVLTLGMFSLLQIQFNLSIIAAILTIVGYSLNDTVVIFDRVRENLIKYKSRPLREVLNQSINETLSRTLMTSATTLVALIALYVLGGEVIRGFTFAMIWGVIVGTYSTVFVASVILLRLGVKRDWSKPDPAAAGTQFAGGDS
ncbi:protein translocase subunit SecF [Oceanomicrobium pacificus]|uniref:Protein-export membrane protein SecF n=1 Tax=Oceanomicrobium pacificus TaxID=2692916 RepID=A0A6B0TX84_9RHOB|nr:protein translocase subunit SecF [Oceanomicrobium pacificus]MXU65633.1 protein translocase subunit SecF [Oceanomicrobium pacificus]